MKLNIKFTFFSLLLFSLWLSGCQTTLPPTRVVETQVLDLQQLTEHMRAPLQLTEQTIVIDSRSSFDYTMAHVPGSIHLRWEDFSQGRSAGERLARRLALLGIHRDSSILILGRGLNGRGEEGRLAWSLYFLGLSKIQIANIDVFAKKLTNVASPLRQNVPYWEPKIRFEAEVKKEELLHAPTKKIYIIDVRSHEEYFSKSSQSKNASYKTPDLQAINIEWKEFFQSDGRPNLTMKEKLGAIDIHTDDRIILISQKGIRSAAVTMALLSMGFQQAGNYSGGYQELLKK